MTGPVVVRAPVVTDCTAQDRDALARAFVTPHAVTRYRAKVDPVSEIKATQAITAGLRDHAARVRSRVASQSPVSRFDVDIEPGTGAPWVARIVSDPDRGGKLVIETVLDHRSRWTEWATPDHTGGLWVTQLRLDLSQRWVRDAAVDVCVMHRRVLDLVEDHPEIPGARPLWAQPNKETLLVRSTRPVDATPPRLAAAVSHLPWTLPDRPGRWQMTAAVNPCQNSKSTGAEQRRGKGKGRKIRLWHTDAEVSAWLARKLPGADLVHMDMVATRSARGTHHGRNVVTTRVLTVAAVVDVHDPGLLAGAVAPGIGPDKTWGLGLSLWEPAQ